MIWPVTMNGISTGRVPIQVKRITRFKVAHKIILEAGRKCLVLDELVDRGRERRIRIDITRAITPPSLFGIDRRIA